MKKLIFALIVLGILGYLAYEEDKNNKNPVSPAVKEEELKAERLRELLNLTELFKTAAVKNYEYFTSRGVSAFSYEELGVTVPGVILKGCWESDAPPSRTCVRTDKFQLSVEAAPGGYIMILKPVEGTFAVFHEYKSKGAPEIVCRPFNGSGEKDCQALGGKVIKNKKSGDNLYLLM